MALEVFQGASIPRELSSAAMEFLWAKWKTLTATRDLTLQRLTEESSHNLRDNIVLMLSVGDDFVHMYVGEAVLKSLRRNPTGRLLSASRSPLARDLQEFYRQAAKYLTPSFVRLTGPHAPGEIWQGLVLPIKLADETIMLVCYTEQVTPQREVYEYLFQNSPDAMVVASPICSDVGDALDGWVVMINEAARRLLNFNDAIANLRLKHLPQLKAVDFTFKLHPPVSPGTLVRTVQGAEFELDIVRFAHVFALIIRPHQAWPVKAATAPALAPV